MSDRINRKRQVSIYLPPRYIRRAKEMGNISEYFRRASDALEVYEESVFLSDYLYLARKLRNILEAMNKKYEEGKLTRGEEELMEVYQNMLLDLLRHPWNEFIQDL